MEHTPREIRGLKYPQLLKYLITAAVIGILIVIIYSLEQVLIPVFISFIIAYALRPTVDWLERKKINRSMAVTSLFLAFFLLLTLLLVLLIPVIHEDINKLLVNLPQYVKNFQDERLPQFEKLMGRRLPYSFSEFVNSRLSKISNLSYDVLEPLSKFALKILSNILDFIINLLNFILIPLFAFYFMRDYHKLEKMITDLIPLRYHDGFRSISREIDSVLSNFIRGQCAVCCLLAVCYSLGLYFIGIDLAVVVGVTSGILFIIPYVGTLVGIVWASILALIKFGDFLHVFYVLGWFGFVHLWEGYYFTPKLVGHKLGLHPMLVIVSLLIGGEVLGLLGILIAVPVTAILKVFINYFLKSYKKSSFFLGT
jgi:predicted PurR-regulated permease PerM